MTSSNCACAALIFRAAVPSVLLAMASASSAAQTPAARVQRGVTAMGGDVALRALVSTNYEFNSATFSLGQEQIPGSPAAATIASGRIVTDYRAARRSTVQELRAPTGVITRQRRIVANGIGMTENNGVQAPDAPLAVVAAEAAVRVLPDRLLLSALDNPLSLSMLAPRRFRGELMDGVRFAKGADTVSLWFDRLNGLLAVTERVTDDGVLGDRRNTVMYTRWVDAGGVRLPREINSEANGRLVATTLITSASINGALDDAGFAIPDSVARRALRPTATPAPIVVTLADVGANVWRAEGGSHHSLVVKQGGALLVIEMPQTTARSRAVLDSLKSRFPGVPVRTAVNTHHHWDHSGGVREYLAQGIPVVTHPRNVEFVRGIAAAGKTVAPDALSRGRRVPIVRAATDSLVIGTGDARVELYELANAHAEGMLVAYVPALRLLFVADVVQPGPGMSPGGSRELVAMVRARGLVVDRVAGAHASIVPWADVVAAATR